MAPAAWGSAGRGHEGVDRDLHLQQQHGRAGDHRFGGVDVSGRQPVVGAGHDDDRVLAAVVDQRQADAGALRRVDGHVGVVDGFVGEAGVEPAPEVIVAETSDHGGGRAGACARPPPG